MSFIRTVLLLFCLLTTSIGVLAQASEGLASTSSSSVERQASSPTDLSLQQQLLTAQIRNQEAQANYYLRQSNSLQTIISGMSGLLGTLLGAAIALIGLRFQARHQSTLESSKWERTREDERKKDARLATAEFAKRIAAAAYSMTWLLWVVKYDSKNFRKDLIKKYDDQMYKNYLELVAAQVVVAGYDKSLHEKTQQLVHSIYKYDHTISLCIRNMENPDNVQKLNELSDEVYQFSKDIPSKVSGMFI